MLCTFLKNWEAGEAHRQSTLNKAKPPQDSGYATGAYNSTHAQLLIDYYIRIGD